MTKAQESNVTELRELAHKQGFTLIGNEWPFKLSDGTGQLIGLMLPNRDGLQTKWAGCELRAALVGSIYATYA